MRLKLYDSLNHRLLFLDREANEEFWDEKWERSSKATFANPPRHGMTVRLTERFLPKGSRILEGGCGLGDVVHALDKNGFAAEGIDYAPKVVTAINSNWPHLKVTTGDVRALPCAGDYYDGYWSFGVIEHFTEGYDAIAREMHRVIRPGGYLFLSFPAFNSLRRSKAAAGKYPLTDRPANEFGEFNQFALDPARVRSDFEALGFELVEHKGISSLFGLAEEWRWASALHKFIDRLPSVVGTATSMAMDVFIGRHAGHSCLFVLRKKVVAIHHPQCPSASERSAT